MYFEPEDDVPLKRATFNRQITSKYKLNLMRLRVNQSTLIAPQDVKPIASAASSLNKKGDMRFTLHKAFDDNDQPLMMDGKRCYRVWRTA